MGLGATRVVEATKRNHRRNFEIDVEVGNVMAISLAVRRFRARMRREASLSKAVAHAAKELEMRRSNV